MESRIYLAIDLKSFYASVECVELGCDPLRTHLVVADETRTEKTICLAVSPALKSHGVPGRPRLFEVEERVREINEQRRLHAPNKRLTGSSSDERVLQNSPETALDYIVARPRMSYYMKYSAKIYEIYLKHVAPEDIHVYSIDEVFIDATRYLGSCGMTAKEFARELMTDVLRSTGITATAGIGTNLYLCKIAMDVLAKKTEPDENGARIAELDERSYRELLWDHRPLTDFWRVGRGYAKKLEANGLRTMGDIARCSLGEPSEYYSEELLYRLFGVNAELLIDHAWGYEPCTLQDIRDYRPDTNSLSSGQVLSTPYDYEMTRVIIREMSEALALELLSKRLATDQITLTLGYDADNVRWSDPSEDDAADAYGRRVPKHAHGTVNLGRRCASPRLISDKVLSLFDSIMNRKQLVRRVTICANRVLPETETQERSDVGQLSLFDAPEAEDGGEKLEREKNMQRAILSIKKKYGANAILKGTNFEKGATGADRNSQIGGHRA